MTVALMVQEVPSERLRAELCAAAFPPVFIGSHGEARPSARGGKGGSV